MTAMEIALEIKAAAAAGHHPIAAAITPGDLLQVAVELLKKSQAYLPTIIAVLEEL